MANYRERIEAEYEAIEKTLTSLPQNRSIELHDGPSWHQNLINSAVKENIISEDLALELKKYLGFRHYAAHGYAFNLEPDKLQKLTGSILATFEKFKNEINKNI